MTLPATNLAQVTIVGHLSGGEVFNTGYWLRIIAGGVNQAQLQTICDGIAAQITSTSFATTRGLISSTEGYDKVRIYYHPLGAAKAQLSAESNITSVVGSGTSYHPLQVALVIGTRNGVPGPSNRGRMYVPATSVLLAADHQIGSSSLSAIMAEWQAHLNAVNQLTNVETATIVSRVGAGKEGTIVQLVGDTRLDVQRRRANKETVTAKVSLTVTP